LLVSHGHAVCGIDSSPLLIDAAREAGGYEKLICSDAGGASLPWDDGSFDLVVSHMVLQDMTDPAACIADVARVLGPAGVFCVAIPNPVNAPAGSRARCFDEMRGAATVARDGLTMEFVWIDRPRSFDTEALASSGFVSVSPVRLMPPAPSSSVGYSGAVSNMDRVSADRGATAFGPLGGPFLRASRPRSRGRGRCGSNGEGIGEGSVPVVGRRGRGDRPSVTHPQSVAGVAR
jgi:SAM-dependent methyltransferase